MHQKFSMTYGDRILQIDSSHGSFHRVDFQEHHATQWGQLEGLFFSLKTYGCLALPFKKNGISITKKKNAEKVTGDRVPNQGDSWLGPTRAQSGPSPLWARHFIYNIGPFDIWIGLGFSDRKPKAQPE